MKNSGSSLFKLWHVCIACLWFYSVSAQTIVEAKAWLEDAEKSIFQAQHIKHALKNNAKAARFFQQQQLLPQLRHTKLNAITAQLQAEQFKQAWEALQELNKLPIIDDDHIRGLFLTNKAWALWGMTRYQEALAIANQAARHWKEQKNMEHYCYAVLLGAYSLYYSEQDNFAALEAKLILLEKVIQEKGFQKHLVGRHFYQLQGILQQKQGHIEQAIRYSLKGLKYEEQALAIYRQKKDSNRVANSYSQLGKLYAKNRAFKQSVHYYEKAFEWYKNLQNYGKLVKISVQLGQLQKRLGKYTQANRYFSQLQLYLNKVPQSPIWQKRHNTFLHLTKTYYYEYFAHHDSILAYYNKHLPYLQKHQLAVEKAYQNIGRAAEALHQYSTAYEAYKTALSYNIKKHGKKGNKIAQIYYALSSLASQQQDTAAAIAYFDQAIIALLQQQTTQTPPPNAFYNKALAAQIYEARGNLYFQQAAYTEAQQDFNQAIAIAHFLRNQYTEQQSKLSSAEWLRPIYEKAAICVWHQQKGIPNRSAIATIFRYAENSKASLLYESLKKFRNQYKYEGIGVPDSILQKEEQLLLQIARYQEQQQATRCSQDKQCRQFYFNKIFALEQEFQQLEQYLIQTYPHYKTWDHGHSEIPTLSTIQENIKEGQVLVEYFLANHSCFVFYISAEQVALKRVSKNQEEYFTKCLHQLRHLLSGFEEAQQDSTTFYSFAKKAYWLYHNYLEHPILKGKQELLLVLDQDLHYIPFETLLFKAPVFSSNNAYEQLPYLLKKYALQYHYSATLFIRTKHQVNTTSGKILGFAATYGNQNDYYTLSPSLLKERSKDEVDIHNISTPIPGTIDELTYLQQHFKGDFFLGELANERQFKKHFSTNNYSIVHLAMHGIINYNQPAYSSLIFTENLDSLEDNLLYIYETEHLDGQQANLVVLSACKTGYGRYAEGEGIISLGRSFMQAGVPSVVMTLWELSDVTSIKIMSKFYALLSTGLVKDEALRQAKLQYLQDNHGILTHPFFWASPILIGNAAPIVVEHRQKGWMLWALLGGLSIATVLSWRVFGH